MTPPFHLATIFFLSCPSLLNCFLLYIVRDLISFSHIKSFIFILDDAEKLGSVRRDIFRLSETPSKVILKKDLWQMQNLSRMGNCGVFLKVQDEKSVSQYLSSVLQLNSFDSNIFKTLHWFIFLNKKRSLDNIYRYDSNVYLIIGDNKGGDMRQIVETYSVEEGVKIDKKIGTWSSEDRLGRKLK